MKTLWQDLRYAVRTLLRKPGFTTVAVITLALGIGPNTAIFSVVYATLLGPLPFPQPDQLVMVWSKTPSSGRSGVSAGDYLAWKESATSFQYLEASTHGAFNLATPDEPLRVRARQVTPDGHRLFGEGVALGRDFLPNDDQPGRNHVVLLSNRLWRERYGADPGIIGRDIRMDGRPYTVAGVLPAGSSDRLPADLWIPLTFKPDQVTHAARTLSAGGLMLGVAGAYALGRAMQGTLFGTGAMNVPVLLAVSAVLLASALLACYVPARRASTVDPMIALRLQ